MRAQLLHLSGPRRGVTDTPRGERIVLGSADDADVRYPPASGVAARHAVITFDECGCDFLIRAQDGDVFVGHEQVREVILRHGDLIELGAGGPKARFRVWQSSAAPCKPVRTMLGDAKDVAHESGVAAGGTTLVRDLLTQATWTLKIGFPLVIAGALVLAFASGWFGGGRAAEGRMQTEFEAVREEIAELRARQTERVTKSEIESLRKEFEERTEELDELAQHREVMREVIDTLSRGVCLIHGRWGFRVPDEMRGNGPEFFQNADGGLAELEYTGSGFHVGGGRIVTNRHVVLPWESLSEVAGMLRQGFEPVMFRLTVTFPGHRPTVVDPAAAIVRTGDRIDVAVLLADVTDDVPVLEIDERPADELGGETVLVVGYPTGINALLAKADDSVSGGILDRALGDLGRIIDGLADTDSISPVVTRGVLSEARSEKLVYDAVTTAGGSGGPVIAANGRVIGVNFAVLPGFGGTNFGVPIGFAAELLD